MSFSSCYDIVSICSKKKNTYLLCCQSHPSLWLCCKFLRKIFLQYHQKIDTRLFVTRAKVKPKVIAVQLVFCWPKKPLNFSPFAAISCELFWRSTLLTNRDDEHKQIYIFFKFPPIQHVTSEAASPLATRSKQTQVTGRELVFISNRSYTTCLNQRTNLIIAVQFQLQNLVVKSKAYKKRLILKQMPMPQAVMD